MLGLNIDYGVRRISSLTPQELSDEEKRLALIRIAQYVMRDEVDKTRDALLEDIVETALYFGTERKNSLLLDEINGILQKDVAIQLPRKMLSSILFRLKEQKRVKFDGRYSIEDSRKREMSNLIQENTRYINQMNRSIIENLEQKITFKLSEKQKADTLDSFYSFISALFLADARTAARLLTGQTVEVKKVQLPKEILKETTKPIQDDKIRKALQTCIMKLFQNPSNEFAQFLFSLNQNLVIIQILNLDPECQTLQRQAFSKKNAVLGH